jgi:enamine deaminase RidA (YjgF/YER057c/UK114 family)
LSTVVDGGAGLRFISPPGFARPRGYSNGIVARGPTLYVAGQIGWDPQACEFTSSDFGEQFARALDNVLAVVHAAGATAAHIVRLTVYVVDVQAYRDSTPALGPIWRARFGRHYPVMALVGVAALVEPRALVEIEATAVLPEEPREDNAPKNQDSDEELL